MTETSVKMIESSALVKISPETRTVRPVDSDEAALFIMKNQKISIGRFSIGEKNFSILYHRDSSTDPNNFFAIRGGRYPLPGDGLILTRPPVLTLAWLHDNVRFPCVDAFFMLGMQVGLMDSFFYPEL